MFSIIIALNDNSLANWVTEMLVEDIKISEHKFELYPYRFPHPECNPLTSYSCTPQKTGHHHLLSNTLALKAQRLEAAIALLEALDQLQPGKRQRFV